MISYTLATNTFFTAGLITTVAFRLVLLNTTLLCHHISLFIFKIDEFPYPGRIKHFKRSYRIKRIYQVFPLSFYGFFQFFNENQILVMSLHGDPEITIPHPLKGTAISYQYPTLSEMISEFRRVYADPAVHRNEEKVRRTPASLKAGDFV